MHNYRYLCTQKSARNMTEVSKKYRLNSMEEPTDEMLQELMEDVAKAARELSARAEAEKQRRLQTVANEIEAMMKKSCGSPLFYLRDGKDARSFLIEEVGIPESLMRSSELDDKVISLLIICCLMLH